MLGFLTNITTWFDQMLALPSATVLTLMKLGAKVATFVPKGAEEAEPRRPLRSRAARSP